MSNTDESGDIKESFVEDKYKIDIEETSVNLGCVKNEPNKALDFIENSHPTQCTITLEYENLFGESSHQIKIEENCDNLIGFLDNDVMMETAVIKLEAIKEEDDGSFINFHCSKCKGIYKGYCLKCSTLLHILNNNLAFTNSGSELNTTPTDILEIRENSRGKGVYLLRTLPKNVIFGPFEGILGIESTVGHSWKIMDNKLRNIKSGNWMKDIVCASSASLKNLDIFQIDGNLYFQTNREITEGEELLIYYDDKELQHLDNSADCLYTPQKQDKLPKIFACTICCLGFGSNKCLIEHKGKCPVEHSRGMKDFVLVECHCCKMWIEKWEHEEHHVAYCLEKHHRMSSEYSEAVDPNDANVEEMKDDCGTRAGKRRYRRDIWSRSKDGKDDLQFDRKDYQSFSGGNQEDRLNESALVERSNNEQLYTIETDNKSRLQAHLNKHKGIKPFTCDICMMKFTVKRSLARHIKNKHNDATDKDYKCLECSYQTNYKNHFQTHLNKHRGISFTCDICMMTFTNKDNLKMHNNKSRLQGHLNKHKGIKPFTCDNCLMKFTDMTNLKMHIRNKHTDDRGVKDYKCSECSYQTNHKTNLQIHLNKHKGIKPFTCDICMMKFTVKRSLARHIKNKHNDATDKDYKCLECSYQTNYKNHFHTHLNKHRGITFTCDICMMTFTNKDNLKMHIKNKHTDDGNAKDYKCSECSYATNYKINFQRHLNQHTGIKAFQCDICLMKYTAKWSLAKHIKNKHNDGSVKNNKCLESSYQTHYKCNLQKHLNKHAVIKPFQCDICMVKFTQKRSVKIHMKNKHRDDGGVKDYKCLECSYQTNNKSDLQRHLNMHKGIKAFQCDICMMKFSRKDYLRVHINNKHTYNADVGDYKCLENE